MERKNRRAFAQEGGSGQPYQILVSSQAKQNEEMNHWLWHIGEWASLGTWWQSFHWGHPKDSLIRAT